jgi:hypothetical protein
MTWLHFVSVQSVLVFVGQTLTSGGAPPDAARGPRVARGVRPGYAATDALPNLW